MNKDLLRTGDKGHIKFRFMYRPEYLKVGTTILFREGRTKGLGVVSSVVNVAGTS
jgi:GTPase